VSERRGDEKVADFDYFFRFIAQMPGWGYSVREER